MSRAAHLLNLIEKFAKPVYDDKPHIEDLEQILKNVQSAVADIKAAGSKIMKKSDLEKFNKCIMGLKGSSTKVAEIAREAKEAMK